jgi:hypothetical protein
MIDKLQRPRIRLHPECRKHHRTPRSAPEAARTAAVVDAIRSARFALLLVELKQVDQCRNRGGDGHRPRSGRLVDQKCVFPSSHIAVGQHSSPALAERRWPRPVLSVLVGRRRRVHLPHPARHLGHDCDVLLQPRRGRAGHQRPGLPLPRPRNDRHRHPVLGAAVAHRRDEPRPARPDGMQTAGGAFPIEQIASRWIAASDQDQ